MKTPTKTFVALVSAFLASALSAEARVVLIHGFEDYPAGTSIHNQPVGSGAWVAANLGPDDLARVSSSQHSEGTRSLVIVDNNPSHFPRVSLDLVAAGLAPCPLVAGLVEFDVREDPSDGGAADAFTIYLGKIKLLRKPEGGFAFSVENGPSETVSFSGAGYTYTPGSWNTLGVEFDDTTHAATLFINGVATKTLTSAASRFTVQTPTFAAYSSSSVGHQIYFDNLRVFSTGSQFSADFEEYADGDPVSGMPAGDTTWTLAGFASGDVVEVNAGDAYRGDNAILIADNGANRPRVTVNLQAGGFLSAPAAAGAVAFAVKEDTADGGSGDRYTMNFSGIKLNNEPSQNRHVLSVAGLSTTKAIPYSTSNYNPSAWNDLKVVFSDADKTASLHVGGVLAGTLQAPSGSTADFRVGQFTFGTYDSGATGDKLQVDAVRVLMQGETFSDGFETYANNETIHNKPVGTTTWIVEGITSLDYTHVQSDAAYEGGQSLFIADNSINRPRAKVNLVNGGFLSAPATSGSVSFVIKEDDSDDGEGDRYTLNIGTMKISNTPDDGRLLFSVAGGSFVLHVPYQTATYTYDPDDWNVFQLVFDDEAKAASLYLNGGYAGSVNAPLDSSVAFTVTTLSFETFTSGTAPVTKFDAFWVDAIHAEFNVPHGVAPWRSSLYPADWEPGHVNADGHFLHDFSYAGYQRGEVPVPTVSGPIHNVVTGYGADPTGATDSTAAIQAAIDAAGAAGGGVVYLPAGTYKVAPPQESSAASLLINKPNIVLRGAGHTQTFLHNTQDVMRNKSVILVRPDNMSSSYWYAGTNSTPLTADLTSPTTQIPVQNAGAYSVGDLIVIRNDLTSGFIADIGMTGKSGWLSSGDSYYGRMLTFCRRVVGKSGNTLVIDVPTRYPIKTRDNARVLKHSAMLTEIGIEDLSIGMTETTGSLGENDHSNPETGGYNADRSFAISMRGVENGWIARVHSYKPAGNTSAHLLSNGIDLSLSRLITVDSCDLRHSQYKGANGNGYLITVAGQECLVKDTHLEDGRHNISVNKMYASGNVMLRVSLKGPSRVTDFHQFLSMSNLFDGTICDGVMLETRYRGEVPNLVPGWTSTQSVFWNTTGLDYGNSSDGTSSKRVISSYQLNKQGYVIGTQGPAFAVTSSDFVEGVGEASALIPQSLYEDQLSRRLSQ
jgi:Endopolygalacturonase